MKVLVLSDTTTWWVDEPENDDTDTVEWYLRNDDNRVLSTQLEAATILAQFRILIDPSMPDDWAVQKLLLIRKALRESKK